MLVQNEHDGDVNRIIRIIRIYKYFCNIYGREREIEIDSNIDDFTLIDRTKTNEIKIISKIK